MSSEISTSNSDIIEIQETEAVPTEKAQGLSSTMSSLTSFIPMILIFVVFYFLLLRPQEKRRRERERLVSSVKKGEEILTNSGICGVVSKVTENDRIVEVEIAKDVKIKILKTAIAEITSRKQEEVSVPKKNKK